MPDIFLSYNREDQATARRFAEAFEAQGFSVWWDVTLRSGEAYDQVTEEALRTARAVVVLWSQKSVVSRWVRAEATLADRNRTLVPARIEPCDLPIMFELTQTADLSDWQGQADHEVWRAFLADVRRFVGAKAEPAPIAAQARERQPSRGRKPSIAVLPFINRSGVSADDIFADGMAEDLTAALSLSRRTKVIAASATAAYRHGARDLRQIGRDLGVRYLLEGNVRRVGDDFRVSAQLVEAEEGDIFWTQKFDRPLAEIAALQEELVTEVAACLGVEIQRAEMEHALRKPDDITAWEAVLRAEANIGRQTLAGYKAAVAEARRAIEIDPDYDLAHATLITGLALCFMLEGDPEAKRCLEIMDIVARARAFDSSDPIVHSRIAVGLYMVGRTTEALPFAERAVAMNPNLETPHMALGQILVRLGRLQDAIAQFEAAERLAPNSVWGSLASFWRGVIYFRAGEFDRSLELTVQALRNRPYVPAQLHRMVCLAMLNRWDEAANAMATFRSGNAAVSFPVAETQIRRNLYEGFDAGKIDECVTVLRRLWEDM